ncbi:MAG: M56 family metallopeptidase, partial [Chitinophagales bacterium]
SKQNRRRSDVFYPEPLQLFSDRVSTTMHIRKPVRVLLVEWVDTAQTIGFLKPLVLLPVALVNRLSMEQAETILLHELLHIRRNDYLINIVMTIFRALFFFNPFARLFFNTVARERENACDDGVLQWHCSAPVVYAEALYNLEKYRQNPNTFSLAANGDNPGLLMERIRRVTGQPSCKKSFSPGLSFCLAATFCLFIMIHAFSRFPKQAPAPVSAKPVTTAIPASLVSVTEKTTVTVIIHESKTPVRRSPEHRVKIAARHRLKVPDSPAAMVPPAAVAEVSTAVQQELVEESAGDLLQYAGSNQVRNYSNEKAAAHELPLEIDMNGTPYVPSSSFSYMPSIDTLQPDVLRQNKLSALLAVGKLKTDAIQIRLRRQVSRNIEDLRLLKKQSLKLIELKQKKLQPELHRIQTDMQIKKDEIKQLQLEMQIQNGEVITI